MKLFKVISTFLVILTAFLIYAFPVPKLTTPQGKYAIGTTLYDLTDSSRIETYSDLANTNRKFMFQVWYPAESVKEYKKVPWLIQGEATTKGLARLGNLPEFALNQLSLVPSNSYFNAPIASESEKYPVLILSHGWSSSRLLHANIAESLASNGYIVIGIEHTFGSVATTFTDGTTSFFSSTTLPSTDYSSELLENGSRLIETFAADISYVLNSLDDFNQGINGPDVLKGKLDL
ncbi:MAG: hypothetical protein JW708_00550, partial [Vallitaleaceae bacterium]|nr:hypothetical protein [Vallitaleaceae bacterium]